jgi:hypothetical protein
MRNSSLIPRVVLAVLVSGALLFSTSINLSSASQSDSPSTAVSSTSHSAHLFETFVKLPLSFEANQGQVDSRVKFLARGAGYSLYLTTTEAVMSFRKSAIGETHESDGKENTSTASIIRMRLVGAEVTTQLIGREPQPGHVNYFIGNDPGQWHTQVPMYAMVEYRQVYPGINLIYYGNQRQLEYDFVVSPGADPTQIALLFEGTEAMAIESSGDLVLQTSAGELRQHRPRAYQIIDGRERTVEGQYVVRPAPESAGVAVIGFQLAAYDTSYPLIIDPILSYSTYLGGSSSDQGFSIAVDQTGAAYIAGATASADFPLGGPMQPASSGGQDAFVTKLSVDGPAIVYSSYLGGMGDEKAFGIAVDLSGSAYVTGFTASANFPTTNPIQMSYGGGTTDVFIAKLNGAGSALVYSTYLGGNGADVGDSVILDSAGNVYATGYTSSTNFRTVNAIQSAPGGNGDAFILKLNATGSALIYSTYLGGTGYDEGFGIAVDTSNNAYVTGATRSFNFPTAGPLQAFMGNTTCADDGTVDSCDAFVSKLNTTGSALVYSTYLGGTAADIAYSIAVDAGGNAYVSGKTASPNFPTASPLQPTLGGMDDAFVSKLNPSGSTLLYSTYLGGNNYEDGFDIAVDATGNAYVVGSTSSTNFPTVSPLQSALGGEMDAYVAKINPNGSSLAFATYLGGSTGTGSLVIDQGLGIALDAAGTIYVTGSSNSSDFPTTPGVFQSKLGGTSAQEDAFVSKISFSTLGVSLTVARGGTGSGAVVSTPTGITCSPTCVANFSNGSQVTLTATPATGSTFGGWTGGGCSGTGACTVTLSGATSVMATFALSVPTFSLTVSKTGGGSGTISCAGTGVAADCSGAIANGTVVTLTATPTTQATFGSWSGCTPVAGMPAQCTVTVTGATAVTAMFAMNVPAFGITVNKVGTGTGTVSCAGTGVVANCSGGIASGTLVTLTAVPDSGSSFAGWGGDCNDTGQVTMNAAKTCTATFTVIQTALVSSVLPTNRSVRVGTLATAFAAIVNIGPVTGTNCRIQPLDTIPATFVYQTTNPATNQVTQSSNTPVDIPGNNGLQTFVIGFTPTAPFASTDVRLSFQCANSPPVPISFGLNTLLLSASSTPVPDIVAVTALPPPPQGQAPNTVLIPGPSGTTLFGTAAVNVGASGTITASADTGSVSLPLTLGICLTFPPGHPQAGQCQAPFAPSVTIQMDAGATPSFAVVVTGTGTVPFNPAVNRINVRFLDAGNVIRGATNVAVQTQ